MIKSKEKEMSLRDKESCSNNIIGYDGMRSEELTYEEGGRSWSGGRKLCEKEMMGMTCKCEVYWERRRDK